MVAVIRFNHFCELVIIRVELVIIRVIQILNYVKGSRD